MFEQNPLVSTSDVQSLGSGAAETQVLVLVGQPPKQRWQLVGGYPIDGDFRRIGLATLLPCVGDSQQVHQHLQQHGRWQGMARDGKDGKPHHDFQHEPGVFIEMYEM